MSIGFTIKWTAEASTNLEEISHYIEEHWTEKEIRKFFIKLEKQLEILAHFPTAYPTSKKHNDIHRCVFTRELTIYYTIQGNTFVLLSVFDVRQDPQKSSF